MANAIGCICFIFTVLIIGATVSWVVFEYWPLFGVAVVLGAILYGIYWWFFTVLRLEAGEVVRYREEPPVDPVQDSP